MVRSRFDHAVDTIQPFLIGLLFTLLWQTYQNSRHLHAVESRTENTGEEIRKSRGELQALKDGIAHQSRSLDRIVELLSQRETVP